MIQEENARYKVVKVNRKTSNFLKEKRETPTEGCPHKQQSEKKEKKKMKASKLQGRKSE